MRGVQQRAMTAPSPSSLDLGPLNTDQSERPVAMPVAALPERSGLALWRELSRRWQARGITALLAAASIGVLFAVWYLGTKYQLEAYIRFKNVPTPAAVLQQALEVTSSSKFLVNVLSSERRILLGFAIATLLGVVLGLMIGKYQRVREFCMPVIEVLRPIPAIAWVPM